jgi:hypothetical protein
MLTTLLAAVPQPPVDAAMPKTTFTFLDRTMPLYICFVYPWYVGGMG